jgi:hypothetical protein
MQATTAAIISATAGCVSAIIAAVSAWNSMRSAQASVSALRETREQRSRDAAQAEIGLVGAIYDDALALSRALSAARSGPAGAVDAARAKAQRSMLVAGFSTPVLERLVAATSPMSTADIDELRAALTDRIAELRSLLTAVGVTRAD